MGIELANDAVARPTALDHAIARLEVMIVDELEPGMQMKSEGELAIECDVSRLTIREALKVLAGRGLVELSRGKRPLIKEPDSAVLSGYLAVAIRRDPGALLELVQIRRSLEVLSVTLAARNARRASVAAIDTAYQAMAAAAAGLPGEEEETAYHEADVAFHEALALASGNRMLTFILEGLEESLRHSFHRSFAGRLARGESAEAALEAHRQIFERVQNGDARGAATAMREHLKDAERDLRAALRGPEGPLSDSRTRSKKPDLARPRPYETKGLAL